MVSDVGLAAAVDRVIEGALGVVAGEAHKLISIAGNVGLERLSESARVLEEYASTGKDIKRPLLLLNREYELALPALRSCAGPTSP